MRSLTAGPLIRCLLLCRLRAVCCRCAPLPLSAEQLLDVLYPLLVELMLLTLMDESEPLNPALSAPQQPNATRVRSTEEQAGCDSEDTSTQLTHHAITTRSALLRLGAGVLSLSQ